MNDVSWEMIILIIIVALIVFAVLGIYIGTRISSDKKRIRELEGELADTQKELEGYRLKVNDHFKKTSELFTEMTSTYKAVYLHLAEGSHELCTNDAALLNPTNEEFLKVAHEVKQKAAEEVPVQAVEKPLPEMEPPDHPHPASETPEKPEPAETGTSDTAPVAEAEKTAQQVSETPEQVVTETQEQTVAETPEKTMTEPQERQEAPPVEPAVQEEVADTAEPDSTPEDSEDQQERLRVVGS